MSLTIALEAVDGLVLAADSRVTDGYTLEGPRTQDNSVKLLQLNDDWGIQTYGLSEIGCRGITALRDDVARNLPRYRSLSPLLHGATEVFTAASSEWTERNANIHRSPKDVGFVLGGYDQDEGNPTIFNFQSPDFSPARVQQGCLLAGQWHIAKYFIRRLYAREISTDKAKELAVLALSATMTVEKTVGGAIHLAVVSPDVGFCWASHEEIEKLLRRSERFQAEFRSELGAALGHALNAPAR